MSQPPDRPLQRTRLESADLGAAWEDHAAEFIGWARKPGHDSYWLFHRDQFLELLPPPGRRTLDVGSGEGRLSRDLKAIGHDVVAVDLSPTMLAAAGEADPELETHLADAADLPLDDASFDLVVADSMARDGLEITFVSEHRPIQAYVNALADAGLVVERLRETDVPDSGIVRPRSRRWQRLPLFLHMRALKPR